ncbi:MAG: DNA-processing protein DprA [Chitinophagaceae bacterium]
MKKNIPVSDNELPYLLALTMINGIGNHLAKILYTHCGSAKAVFGEKLSLLKKIPGIGTLTAKNIHSFNQFDVVENELKLIQKHHIKSILYFDDEYPKRLKEIDDSPLVLFSKGMASLDTKRMLAIVGTRNSTLYGKQFTDDLIEALKPYQTTIVSGLAAGTDTNVHKACLRNNVPTIGVLGHGFSTIYPGHNRKLASDMLHEGALLTEFKFNTPGNKENFPRRNRIVAGMCDAVIVAESGIKGGSMITADLANQYNRDVFALPGKISDTYSLGCNRLISQHQAAIVDSVSGLISLLGYDAKPKSLPSINSQLLLTLNQDETSIVNVLKKGDAGIDQLYYSTNLPMTKLAFLLLDLEFRGVLRNLPGKVYQLCAS